MIGLLKKKGKNYERFFNQYGMTEITYEDYQHLQFCGMGEEVFNKNTNNELVKSHVNFHSEDHSSEDKWSLQKNRGIDQKIFSDEIKDTYSNKCCVTGIKSKFLLNGCHIVPWSEDKSIRKDLTNGLCLSIFIHKCFDNGYLMIDDYYKVILSKKIKQDLKLFNLLKPYEGKKINLPKLRKYYPEKNYLKKHREKF